MKTARCTYLRQFIKFFITVLVAATLAGCAGKTLRINTLNGSKINVFEWGFWNNRCQASDFTIKITQRPEFGVVEMGTDTMVIRRTSASGARMACEGRKVASKVVYYTANAGFKGTDRMRLTVAGPFTAPRLFTVEMTVR